MDDYIDPDLHNEDDLPPEEPAIDEPTVEEITLLNQGGDVIGPHNEVPGPATASMKDEEPIKKHDPVAAIEDQLNGMLAEVERSPKFKALLEKRKALIKNR